MKILVTDDSKIARRMLIKTFRLVCAIEDLEIFEASNGQEAIDTYKKEKPQLLFMDLTMPVINGFEALEIIKTFDSKAKVVIVSADIQKTSVQTALDLGAFNFAKKPIDEEKMKQILNKFKSQSSQNG